MIILYARTEKLARLDNRPRGFINRTSWAPHVIPLLALPRRQWDEHQLVVWVPLPRTAAGATWVDVVINNLDDGAHPFHLHGHAFYVLARRQSSRGWGSYESGSATAAAALKMAGAIRKDTVMVPRRGFVVVRFRAEQAGRGIWMLHCHMLVHQASGMAMAVQVGGEEGHEVVEERAGGLCGL
jgi:FtsP/CotA-like multicopper oxidase with cupredoxin domain